MVNIMKFTIIENGKEVICNVITTYLDSKSNKSYVIYTDGTKKENGLSIADIYYYFIVINFNCFIC